VPALEIVALLESSEVHVADDVTSSKKLSSYVPVAVNCCVAPLLIVESAGVTPIDCNVLATVNVVTPVTVPEVAYMNVTPSPTPVAVPALDIVAALSLNELHVTDVDISCVEKSSYDPIAVNFCVAPILMLGVGGSTAIEDNVLVTVNVVDPGMLPNVAVMVVVPAATPVAVPALEIVALSMSLELQMTDPVMSDVKPSE